MALERQTLVDRGNDLHARIRLFTLAEKVYWSGESREVRTAAATLLHAESYLRDRVGYEMAPHPKGCIPLPEGLA